MDWDEEAEQDNAEYTKRVEAQRDALQRRVTFLEEALCELLVDLEASALRKTSRKFRERVEALRTIHFPRWEP